MKQKPGLFAKGEAEPVKGQRNFGMAIRAARLGWGWSGFHRCYIRISEYEGHWLVEVCPPDEMPSRMPEGVEHVVAWWQNDPEGRVLRLCAPLEQIFQQPGPVTKVESWVVDDNGKALDGAL